MRFRKALDEAVPTPPCLAPSLLLLHKFEVGIYLNLPIPRFTTPVREENCVHISSDGDEFGGVSCRSSDVAG